MGIHFEGGYYLHSEPLVRGSSMHGHTANDLSQISQYAVQATNHVQDTPWAINPFIMDVVETLHSQGKDIIADDEVMLRLKRPENPREGQSRLTGVFKQLDKDIWDKLTPEQKEKMKAQRAKRLVIYEKELGVYRATKRVIAAAREMCQFEKFYYPHNLDFRTRMYPIPSDLNPQSSDLAKGLIRFRRGRRLGQDGLFWLKFTLATHWGEDKLAPEERVAFVDEGNLDEIVRAAVTMPHTSTEWHQADKPFMFLATAMEFHATQHWPGNVEDFVSYLPGNLDGSCNGAQHLSIMTRDLVGATATNCRSLAQRFDLYQEVGDRVYEEILKRCRKDNEEPDQLARVWRAKLADPKARRKCVKRAVMTVPYGVSRFGVAEMMMTDDHVTQEVGRREQWDEALYIRDIIWASIGATIAKGQRLQEWFSDCASTCAKAGKPLQWVNPAGSKITQAYYEIVEERIQCHDMRFYLYVEEEQAGLKEGKMASSAPPNIVHSCDAAHMQITVCRMADAGIRDFSMIHDSFGTHFADMGIMRDILRQSAVDMYEENFILKFKQDVEAYSGLTMPDIPPELLDGDFDTSELLESEFFFS